MRIIELVPELLLHIASFTPQADLLNLSLTCKRLRNVTESELYREYINVRSFMDFGKPDRSLRAFLFLLLDRPELGKHVRRVHLRTLTHLSDLNPREGLLEYIPLVECTPDHYARLTRAAVDLGIIKDVLPYNAENSLLRRIENLRFQIDWVNDDIGDWWENLYDQHISTEDIPYDVQFCKLLRLGIEDPFVVLLMALLPNIRDLTLGKTPYHCYSLRWQVPHRFKALQRFMAWPCDGKLEWPQGPQDLFSTVLAGGKVEFLGIAWSGCALPKEEPDEFDVDPGPIPILLRPNSTRITSLRSSCCTFTKDEMSTILQACAPLKTLYYSFGGPSVSPKNFTLPDLVELLQPHKATLETMYVDMDGDLDYDPDFQSLPSIRDFATLKTMDAGMYTWRNILLGPRDEDASLQWSENIKVEPLKDTATTICSILPPSLATFIIQQRGEEKIPDRWDYRQLEHLLAKRSSILPNLKSLYFVEYEAGTAKQTYEHFDTLVERVNLEDGFHVVVVSSDEEYRHVSEALFNVEQELKQASHYQRWAGDRYLCEVPKRGWRDVQADSNVE